MEEAEGEVVLPPYPLARVPPWVEGVVVVVPRPGILVVEPGVVMGFVVVEPGVVVAGPGVVVVGAGGCGSGTVGCGGGGLPPPPIPSILWKTTIILE